MKSHVYFEKAREYEGKSPSLFKGPGVAVLSSQAGPAMAALWEYKRMRDLNYF